MRKIVRAALALSLALSPVATYGAEVVSIGSRLEPLVDTHLIGSMANTTHRLQTPRMAEMVIAFDKPWEGPFCGYVTIFKDGDLYRMYYRGKPNALADGVDEVTCYAESNDGINWTKPDLGIHAFEGSTATNMILSDVAPYSHNFIAIKDSRPGVPADEQYKGMAGTAKTGLHAFTSADGIHWTMGTEPIITGGAFDSQNVVFWSESEEQYCAYFRTWHQGGFKGFRSVSRATSKDFVNWTEPEEMDFGHTTREHLYTNQTLPYFRAPHIYLSLAARFMPGRRVASEAEATALGVNAKYSGDCSDNVLMSSRGGIKYDRTFMDGFLKPEIGLENWTSRSNYPAWGIIPTGDREISLYVQKYYGSPQTGLRRYTLRPDGFAAVEAPYAGGEMTTKTLSFTGQSLYINYATSAAGSIRVQLLDGDGVEIPGFEADKCFEIIGNQIARAVRWNDSADISSLAGTPVRLRFIMKDAELYSIQFR
jgi:hypothetical protein